MHYSPGVNSSPCRPPGESIRRIKKAISHTALGLSPHKKCVLMHGCVYVLLCKGVCGWMYEDVCVLVVGSEKKVGVMGVCVFVCVWKGVCVCVYVCVCVCVCGV